MVSVKEIPGAMGLGKDQLLELYYKMFLARTVGQRERMLNRMGKGPFAVTGEGHEAAEVGTAYALTPGKDWVLPYYRDIGVALTIGMTPRDLLLAHLVPRGVDRERRAQHALALQQPEAAHRLRLGAGRRRSFRTLSAWRWRRSCAASTKSR